MTWIPNRPWEPKDRPWFPTPITTPTLPHPPSTKNEWTSTPVYTVGETDHVVLLLDGSASMRAKRDETIIGANEWLDANRNATRKTSLTVVIFNTSFHAPVVNTPIDMVGKIDENRYRPNGYTALYDAMAYSINAVSPYVRTGDRVIMCVITDGEENSSKVYNKASIKRLIEQKQGEGNWTITYLSSHIDAFSEAASIGISYGNTRVVDELGPAVYAAAAATTQTFRGTVSASTANFYDDDPVPPAKIGIMETANRTNNIEKKKTGSTA